MYAYEAFEEETEDGRRAFGVRSEVWRQICHFAEVYGMDRVILFGSRARGDYKRVSDIDLAVTGGEVSAFAGAVDEETDTLLEYDVVNLDRAVQQDLRQAIAEEGKLIYEKV